ncbi:MAG: GNAT family N-acetyltransferase [Pseudomonadota bacterium]
MDDLAHPLPQSDAFERTAHRLGLKVLRVNTEAGTCLIQTRRLPVIGDVHLVSRGPVARHAEDAATLFQASRADLCGPVILNAPTQMTIGGIKVAGGAELAILDLRSPPYMRQQMHPKWRNQLKKAERSSLVVIDQPLDAACHKWFLEAEAAQQRARHYRAHPTGFLLAFAHANKGQARLYTALHEGRPVAGMLILKHGRMATYEAGVIFPEGRADCAHNLLLWTIMCDLQARRVRHLDLGRCDLGAGLRRFKLGSGARVEPLPGSFLFYRPFRHAWSQRRDSACPHLAES